MPARAPRPCGRCRRVQCTCPPSSRDEHRGTAAQRGYDANWTRFRSWFLMRHPMCESDRGCRRFASEVHHIIKISEQPALRLVEGNCQALCGLHHRQLRGNGGRG